MEHQHSQLLLRGLDGRTLCLHFGSKHVITGADVAVQVLSRTGIPVPRQCLITGTTLLTPKVRLTASPYDGCFPSCTLLLRLRGGKGGFGSLLRGAATKAGQKKTSNFDACRDMSGRRLRHVNAEKKLKEWKADAEERELERTAEEYLKKDKKAKEEDSGVFQELEKFRAETSRTMEEVGLAVASGLVEARKLDAAGKRKVVEDAAILAKRARLWLGDVDEDDDTDGEEIDEDEIASTSGGANTGVAVVSGAIPVLTEPASRCSSLIAHVKDGILMNSVIDSRGKINLEEAQVEVGVSDGELFLEKDTLQVMPTSESLHSELKTELVENVPVVLDNYQSPEELEGLGLENLKVELQTRGLKCGGSLSERAGRLFLFKTTPLGKLDKKYFAAKSKGSKK